MRKRLHSLPVLRKFPRPLLLLGVFACFLSSRGAAQEAIPQPLDLLISIAEQRMVVLHDWALVGKFRVSTSRFGIGDALGSYRTPVGLFRVCDKVGENLPSGTVIKHRMATNEILPVNAAGRDPIVTRIIWLDGLEEQNRNAKARGIYIHGTVEESRIGQPVSFGCIRMRSRDIVELFRHVSPGTRVMVVAGKLPKLRKYVPPPPPVLIANNTPPPQVGPEPPPAQAEPPLRKSGAPAQRPGEVAVARSKSAPRLASKSKPAQNDRLPEIASGPGKVAADPGAAQAMKGSILSAGLPGGPEKAEAQKAGTMKFQSWSTVSLREVEGGSTASALR